MKLIIDIPEEIYKESKIIDGLYENVIQIPLEAIANGTPIPDNATNGDVVKAMFGEVAYLLIKKTMGEYDWWNAPYQKGGKKCN